MTEWIENFDVIIRCNFHYVFIILYKFGNSNGVK